MIPSASLIVPPVAIIIFKRPLFWDVLKRGNIPTDVRADGNMWENNYPYRLGHGSAEWINLNSVFVVCFW